MWLLLFGMWLPGCLGIEYNRSLWSGILLDYYSFENEYNVIALKINTMWLLENEYNVIAWWFRNVIIYSVENEYNVIA
jgi:hypothetical protein